MKILPWMVLIAGCGSVPATRLSPGPSGFLQANLRACLLGPGWAVELELEDESFQYWNLEFARTLPRDFSPRVVSAKLYRGRDLDRVFVPDSGPPNAEALRRFEMPSAGMSGLKVTLHLEKAEREPEGEVSIRLSGFTAAGEAFDPIGSVTIPIRGPYP